MSDFWISHLRCEYMKNPLGIDEPRPRLSWLVGSNRRGARQTAYQVVVSHCPPTLEQDEAILWDSGQVFSDQTAHIEYGGKPLMSGECAWWRVRTWDEAGEVSEWSKPAFWEMGLLEESDWHARWIGGMLVGGPRTTIPSPFFRKDFVLAQPAVRARLYVTALGLVEPSLNGQRVSEDVFVPGWTDYRKRLQYRTYDVTDLLAVGTNTLGAILGDGWYCGHIGNLSRQFYGDRPGLLAQLTLTLDDGTVIQVGTDESWKMAYGPILESDLLMGESYDARLEFPGWNHPGFDESSWLPVQLLPEPGCRLAAAKGPGVRRIQELQPISDPVEIRRRMDSQWIYDFGQNMVGRVRLKVSGEAGTTLVLRHAEMLNPDGTLYTANLRSARQTDVYTLKGGGEEVYEPRFTFHGFRYVEVSGFPGKPTRDTLTGIVLHSDTPPTGSFECSDPLVNQLQHNITWGQKGNFVDVPTDCPQRDERLGWTGDAQVFIRTATFNMDVAAFFTKWSEDLEDAQAESGSYPITAPLIDMSRGQDGGPAWADAGVICPWTLYLCYADKRLLEQRYASMKRFLDFLVSTSPGYIRCHPDLGEWSGYGDWLSINAETPKDLIGTAFLAHDARLMSKIAAVLGKTDDTHQYNELFQKVKEAFIRRFVAGDGVLAGGAQTAYVLALYFDLLPENLRANAIKALTQDIENRGKRLSTGFVGAPYLPHVLSDNGRLDLAYDLLMQKEWPSWLYPVTKGATTIWERWDGWTHDKGFQDPGMNSFNHYAYGSIGAWMVAVIAGIDADPVNPGFKHVQLMPRPGGGLTYAQATYNSLHGRIVSSWRIEESTAGSRTRLVWEVILPANTTATARILAPDGTTIEETEVKFRREGNSIAVLGAESPHIRVSNVEGDVVILELASGSYHFVVEPFVFPTGGDG